MTRSASGSLFGRDKAAGLGALEVIDGDADAHFDAAVCLATAGRPLCLRLGATGEDMPAGVWACGADALSWHHLLIHSPSLSMTVAMVDLGC